jgi:hypothetical protein
VAIVKLLYFFEMQIKMNLLIICGYIQKVHFDLDLKEKLTPTDCHMYYMPNFHNFQMEIVQILLSTINMWNAISFHCLPSSRCNHC